MYTIFIAVSFFLKLKEEVKWSKLTQNNQNTYQKGNILLVVLHNWFDAQVYYFPFSIILFLFMLGQIFWIHWRIYSFNDWEEWFSDYWRLYTTIC